MWKWTKMLKKRMRDILLKCVLEIPKKKKIFSLAAGVSTPPDEYYVYRDYLDTAMKDPSIRNIAITGNYGIGKSSFLQWYAKKKRYLFVSLCDFNLEENKKNVKETCCDIYRQLMIGCSRMRKANEKRRKRLNFVFATMIVLLVGFYLLLNNTLNSLGLLVEILRNVDMIVYRVLHLPSICDAASYGRVLGLNTIFQYVIDAKADFHRICITLRYSLGGGMRVLENIRFVADILVGTMGFAAAVGVLGRLPSLLSSLKLTFAAKAWDTEAVAELELKNNGFSQYVDQLKVRLIDMLRQEKKRYQSVIIFEDFDRFPCSVSRYLLDNLHDINRLLNYSNSGKEKKPIRFIYVVKDDLFVTETSEPCKAEQKGDGEATKEKCKQEATSSIDKNLSLKFFDFVLPIVPGIYQSASAKYIHDCFEKTGLSDLIIKEFIDIVGRYLSDYRTIRSISNEYQVIHDVYDARRSTGKWVVVVYGGSSIQDVRRMVGLAVYKTLMPEDYAKIKEGKSILNYFDERIPDNAQVDLCIRKLWEKGWLCERCLAYVGLDAVAMKEYAKILLDSFPVDLLSSRNFLAWLNNTYQSWRSELLQDRELMQKVVTQFPYSLLWAELIHGSDSNEWKDFMRLLPYEYLQQKRAVGGSVTLPSEVHEPPFAFDELKRVLAKGDKKYGSAIGFVAVYILELGNADVKWLFQYMTVEEFVSWLWFDMSHMCCRMSYRQFVEMYINYLDVCEQDRLVEELKKYSTLFTHFRDFWISNNLNALELSGELKTKILQHIPDLDVGAVSTPPLPSSNQSPSA